MRGEISGLQIEPGEGVVGVGATLQLQLYATGRNGRRDLIPGNTATWSSSSDGVAEVNRQGRVTARRPGVVNIVAQYRDQTARAQLTVTG